MSVFSFVVSGRGGGHSQWQTTQKAQCAQFVTPALWHMAAFLPVRKCFYYIGISFIDLDLMPIVTYFGVYFCGMNDV